MAADSPRKADEVYDRLLNRFLSAAIEPGARITVDAVAREFGVSQTPVREALGRLESEGLVVKIQLAGYRSAPRMTREDFEHLFEMRLQLEPLLAGKAAEGITPERSAELERMVAEMAALSSVSDRDAYGRFARADSTFHDTIAGWGCNPLMSDALLRLRTHVQIFRLIYIPRITSEAVDEHGEIARALIKGDSFLADAAMRTHISRSRDRLRAAFNEPVPGEK